MSPLIKKEDRTFIGAIVLVHIIFFLLACHYTRIYMGDSFEYIYEALNIKHLHFFYSGNPALPIEPEYMTQRQPLYPLFLMGVYLFTINNWVVIILQNLLSILNIVYIRGIFAKLGMDKKYDWLLLVFIIGYPSQFINANTIDPDILLQSFTLLYFGSFVKWIQQKDIRYAAAMSLWLIAGMMVKPVLYLFAVPHIILLIVSAKQLKAKVQRPLFIALIPLCAVIGYNAINMERTGQFHYSSNQAFNAEYYFYPYLSSHFGQDSAARFWKEERQTYFSIEDYPERYTYANRRGLDLLRQNAVPYTVFHLKHSLNYFVEPGKAEIDLFTGKLTYGQLYSKKPEAGFSKTLRTKGIGGMGPYISRNPSLFIVAIVFIIGLYRLAGLIRFFFRYETSRAVRIFVLLFVAYFALLTGPIANTRYFLPISLIVMCCAVIGTAGPAKTDPL
jgi:hypothetical protein